MGEQWHFYTGTTIANNNLHKRFKRKSWGERPQTINTAIIKSKLWASKCSMIREKSGWGDGVTGINKTQETTFSHERLQRLDYYKLWYKRRQKHENYTTITVCKH